MKYFKLINDDYLGHVEHERQACRGILVRDGKILLVYLNKNEIYMIPGGGVEKGETLVQCCEREMLEESGLEVKASKHVFAFEELFEDWRHVTHYYICELVEDTGELHLTEHEKEAGTTFRWVPVEDAIKEFSRYDEYKGINVSNYGLYRREHLVLRKIF